MFTGKFALISGLAISHTIFFARYVCLKMAEVFSRNIALNHSVQIIHVIEDTASSQII